MLNFRQVFQLQEPTQIMCPSFLGQAHTVALFCRSYSVWGFRAMPLLSSDSEALPHFKRIKKYHGEI